MSIETNKEALSSLSIADLLALVDKFENEMDDLEGLESEGSVEAYYKLSDMKTACIDRYRELIKDIFIY